MNAHPLDHPCWTCLTTDHADLAIGDGPVRRYHPDVSAFAAIPDRSAASMRALRDCLHAHGPLVLPSPWDMDAPDGTRVTWKRAAVQMVFDAESPEVIQDWDIEALSDDDAPEILALARLTKPGPFEKRTHELGQFWGVRRDGRIIGMAGERLRQDGYAEISGICTHPDARGLGLGTALTKHVCRAVIDRGETPYLHAFADNTSAIALYEGLGFKIRRDDLMGIGLEPA